MVAIACCKFPMGPYHSVAMYNQAAHVSTLELPRNHPPPSGLLSATCPTNYHFLQTTLEVVKGLQGRGLFAQVSTFKCTQYSK